jgi:hypothetical protein
MFPDIWRHQSLRNSEVLVVYVRRVLKREEKRYVFCSIQILRSSVLIENTVKSVMIFGQLELEFSIVTNVKNENVKIDDYGSSKR